MEKGFEQQFYRSKEDSSIKKEMEFELALEEKPITFRPVGSEQSLKEIGIDYNEEIILAPVDIQSDQEKCPKTISFYTPREGEVIDLVVVEQWCQQNGWRLATAFELASLREQLWAEFFKKLKDEHIENYGNVSSLENVVAMADTYKGNYISTSRPNWDWALTLRSPEECVGKKFKVPIVKEAV